MDRVEGPLTSEKGLGKPQSFESVPGGQRTRYVAAVGPAETTEPTSVC